MGVEVPDLLVDRARPLEVDPARPLPLRLQLLQGARAGRAPRRSGPPGAEEEAPPPALPRRALRSPRSPWPPGPPGAFLAPGGPAPPAGAARCAGPSPAAAPARRRSPGPAPPTGERPRRYGRCGRRTATPRRRGCPTDREASRRRGGCRTPPAPGPPGSSARRAPPSCRCASACRPGAGSASWPPSLILLPDCEPIHKVSQGPGRRIPLPDHERSRSRCREPEGRGGEDHHHGQSGGRPGRARAAHPARGRRPPGQPDGRSGTSQGRPLHLRSPPG